MHIPKILFLYFFLSLIFKVNAQEEQQIQKENFEKEERINAEDLPQNAIIFLNENLSKKTGKLRYYHESDEDLERYAVSFKFKNYRYLIKFNETGSFLAIDIKIDKKQIPEEVLKKIIEYIENHTNKHSIEDIVAQFSKKDISKNLLKTRFKLKKFKPDNYSFIVAVETDNLKKYKMLFSHQGYFRNKRQLKKDFYEHLLF